MVLRTVFLPTACYTMPPPAYCTSDMARFSSLSLSCAFQESDSKDSKKTFVSSESPDENLENEIAEILPQFESADSDWSAFGYLLNEQPTTSTSRKVTVFQKPVEPIGKGTKRRRRMNADMEIAAAKPKTEVKKEVINPADITLGGDTYDYGKERKPLDSIASGVARRRRTSANLSKSEDDNDHHHHNHPHHSSSSTASSTTRGIKERRTSEPPQQPRVTFYTPSSGSGVIGDIDEGIPHCTCQKLFDASRMYIQCDMCARWYHGDCVGVNEKIAAKFENWTCEQCIEEQERCKEQPALYCVCQKPYDDTKFYVGCDSCQGWFHPECVGTTREQAEQAADYNCPNCIRDGYESEASEASVSSRTSVQLTRADYTHVVELLELLLEHRMSTPFRNPVDLNEFPDYNHIIRKPMDLSTISKKVETTGYLYLGEFVNDVNLMFENAKTYNPKDNAVFKCAETMQEVFDKKLIEVREEMTRRQQLLHLHQQQSLDPMSSARKRVQSESQKTTDSLDIDSDQLLPLDASLMKYFF
ncbi:hypothetical protein CRE_24962 [Caenorhabditis remanei]|uniref:Uncharacterized protein n=1 Tax=Caenorhabditis remanei TaxID=31234 RepID=E3MHN0_CAERE|nr:hypothetical protein CRE_24962 [Caenorhabditis remanei]